MVARIEGSGVGLAQVRGEMERAARAAHERLLMEHLAREMVRQAEVVVMDPALSASWKARRRGGE
jgi:hypothetical protein